MKDRINKPAIRFKGFDEAWEQRELSDMADVIDGDRGKNYPSDDDFSEKGHTLFLSATNVTKEGFSFESNQYITKEKSNQLGNGKLDLNDIVLTSRGSLGHIAWYNRSVKNFVPFARINSGMLILRSKEEVEASYIAQYLKSPLGKGQIDLISFGSAQPQLTKKDVSNYNISIPEKYEQAKLGALFTNIDKLITLHQRKLDKLENFKKSMLEKMFPKNGEKRPEVRFQGFNDAWEQRKLEEIIDVYSGRDYKHLLKGEIPVYGTGGYMLSVNDALSFKDDAIGIGRKGTIDKPYILKAPFWTVDTLFYAIPKANYDLNYVYNIFKNIDWREKDESTGVPSLSRNAINNTVIRVSKYNEQQKIGQFFKSLDKLITLHQRKLEKLEKIKRAMLEKMFV